MDVWNPKIEISRKLLDLAQVLDWKKYRNLRKAYGVEIASHILLICDGACPVHNDPEHPQYTLLWVLRNDTDSYVSVNGFPKIRHQPVGTAIFFDNWEYHKLTQPILSRHKKGLWVAAGIESKNVWNRKECEEVLYDLCSMTDNGKLKEFSSYIHKKASPSD